MMNKITIIGNLGRDPELRTVANNTQLCSFSVASSRRYTTAAGEQREETEWFNCSVFGQLAETCHEYLAKGRQVYVEGRLTSRQYQRNDGTTGFSLDVNVREVQFLGQREDAQNNGNRNRDEDPDFNEYLDDEDDGFASDDDEDDMPF